MFPSISMLIYETAGSPKATLHTEAQGEAGGGLRLLRLGWGRHEEARRGGSCAVRGVRAEDSPPGEGRLRAAVPPLGCAIGGSPSLS